MLTVLGLELTKLLRQKKSWLTLAAMNLVALMALGALLLPPVADAVREGAAAAEMAVAAGQVDPLAPRRGLAALVLLWAHGFSLISMLFMALISGALLSRELGDGSIQVLLAAPVERWRVFAGKVATAVTFYAMAWGLGMVLLGLTWARTCQLDPTMATRLEGLPMAQALGAYAVADLSLVCFFLLVSAACSTETGAVAASLGLYLGMQVLDGFGALLRGLEAMPALLDPLFQYSLVRTSGVVDFSALQAYLVQGRGPFPLRLDLLGANLCWSVLLLALGYAVFRSREDAAES